MNITPGNGFPQDIVDFNAGKLSEAQVKGWYDSLPFEQGVAVNSLCWTCFDSHFALLERIKQLNQGQGWKQGDDVIAVVAYYQHFKRCQPRPTMTAEEHNAFPKGRWS